MQGGLDEVKCEIEELQQKMSDGAMEIKKLENEIIVLQEQRDKVSMFVCRFFYNYTITIRVITSGLLLYVFVKLDLDLYFFFLFVTKLSKCLCNFDCPHQPNDHIVLINFFAGYWGAAPKARKDPEREGEGACYEVCLPEEFEGDTQG